MLDLSFIVSILGMDNVYVSFSSQGLTCLSFKAQQDTECISLKLVSEIQKLIIEQTSNFLETGKHDMPLDLRRFTDFQQSVFEVVSKVELGQLTTYKEIAEKLGKPGAAQAVCNAIAKNPVSYFLPSHRVIPQKGLIVCRHPNGRLQEKLLAHEGHDIRKLSSGKVCTREHCTPMAKSHST